MYYFYGVDVGFVLDTRMSCYEEPFDVFRNNIIVYRTECY